MEYLAAAAFIALDKEDVTLDELSQYGINVTKILEDSHISAVILCSEHYALEMVRNFSDCFDLINDDSTLHLKDSWRICQKTCFRHLPSKWQNERNHKNKRPSIWLYQNRRF